MKNVDLARYIGRPWRAYASGPDAYDCWGLVQQVLSEMHGCEVPRFETVPVDDKRAFHDAFIKEAASGRWVRVPDPQDGCVVMMARGRIFHHVGIFTRLNGGRILHCAEGRGVCTESELQLRPAVNHFEYWVLR